MELIEQIKSLFIVLSLSRLDLTWIRKKSQYLEFLQRRFIFLSLNELLLQQYLKIINFLNGLDFIK